jgi:hypothetical protein
MCRRSKKRLPLLGLLLILPSHLTGCGIDTEGMLIERDTAQSDGDGADGDGSVDGDADDHRPDGDVPHDPPADEGGFPDVPDAETEGPATCAETPASYCDDGLECTDDSCRDDVAGPTCGHAVRSGFCKIDGACVTAWSINLDNECQTCDPSVNDAWMPVEDRTQCYWGGGLCCSGRCIPGADCCSDADCAGCTGTAEPCDTFDDEGDCGEQAGCEWISSGTCDGGYRCDTWNDDSATCNFCHCLHDGHDCNPHSQVHDCSTHYRSFTDCTGYGTCGCTWVSTGGSCGGDPLDCWTLDSTRCDSQSGCSWEESGTCNVATFICEDS